MKPEEWFSSLSRAQVAVMGGTVGYTTGILAGPMVKALIGLILVFAFYFVGKHLDDRFEAELGYVGIAAAILATYLLEPVRHALAGTLGNIIGHTSGLLLAGMGALVALRVQDRVTSDTDPDAFEAD